MQKQEIPPFTPCHSGSDLALNQLVLLQAISRPPWRHPECSLNSRGPLGLGPQSLPDGWPLAAATRTNRILISHCANQRAAEARVLPFDRCEVSGCVHKRSAPVWSGTSCSISRPLDRSHAASPIICFFFFSCHAYSNIMQSSCASFLSYHL